MVTNVDCNLLEYDLDGFVHQANCFHVMGGGIALQIRNKYPEMYNADLKHGSAGDKSRLGKFSFIRCRDQKMGYNMYSQYDLGHYRRMTDYEAMYNGLTRIKQHAINNVVLKLGIPKNMGCTLGGGSWRVVSAIIDDIFLDSKELTVFICNYQPK
jgi:O-acetyl-ADP-ribose deacetylase (regulator of RNase III)